VKGRYGGDLIAFFMFAGVAAAYDWFAAMLGVAAGMAAALTILKWAKGYDL
jgi:hypothetical protein